LTKTSGVLLLFMPCAKSPLFFFIVCRHASARELEAATNVTIRVFLTLSCGRLCITRVQKGEQLRLLLLTREMCRAHRSAHRSL
ncbi:hypothetical protein BGW80DRAFT_1276168, partial [Lactifluus volemus]